MLACPDSLNRCREKFLLIMIDCMSVECFDYAKIIASFDRFGSNSLNQTPFSPFCSNLKTEEQSIVLYYESLLLLLSHRYTFRKFLFKIFLHGWLVIEQIDPLGAPAIKRKITSFLGVWFRMRINFVEVMKPMQWFQDLLRN